MAFDFRLISYWKRLRVAKLPPRTYLGAMPTDTRYFSLQQARETFLRRFLFICILILIYYIIFDIYHHIYTGAVTDLIALIAVGASFLSIRKVGIQMWQIHLTLFGGICLFGPLLLVVSVDGTGLYWLPALPVLTFILGGSWYGSLWAGAYFICLFASMLLAAFGTITLEYDWTQTFSMLLVTASLGIWSYFFVRYLEETESTVFEQQKQLEKALNEAEEASKSKSAFLSTMSHELRTPLHGIIGMQELLSKENEGWSDEQRECLQLSIKSSRALKDLLNDVLDLAKIEANQMDVAEFPLDTLELVRESLIPFAFHAKKKGIQLNLTIENTPKMILSDVMRIRQILFNLLGNAVKFTKKGSVTLKVKLDSSESNFLKFSVEDTGIGIPLTEQKHVFEPFFQCSNSPHDIKGTGLGTSIIKQSVELLKGEILVESKIGHGSRFTFTLPYKNIDEETYSLHWGINEITAIDHTHASPSKPEFTKELHILLVEDDEVSQRIAKKVLTRAGMRVDIASNGLEALEKLKECSFDVMLTDLRMPYMDGITLAKTVRTREKNTSKRLLIIGLSADAMSSVVDKAIHAGIDVFLPKPIEPRAILSCVIESDLYTTADIQT